MKQAAFVAIGIGVGAALGIALDNVALWLALGVVFGVVLGQAYGKGDTGAGDDGDRHIDSGDGGGNGGD